jgi:hypothetical protein
MRPNWKWFLAIESFLLMTSTFAYSQANQEQAIDAAVAERYFMEARTICEKDAGKLWGVSLCGPLLFADPETRAVVANQGDPQGRLSRRGNVFVGKLPAEQGIANTAIDWAGLKWTMIMWPLPSSEPARAALMAHELYHRIQDQIGLPASNPSNNHLDTLEGRLWLQLEWRALWRAMAEAWPESRRAVEDALIFRAHRRHLFPQAAQSESSLEMNEGLAEYTGIKLRGTLDSASADFVIKQLSYSESKPTFVRSFAYASGPAYGFLLDRSNASWRAGLKSSDDLGARLARALSIKPPASVEQEAARRSGKYGGDQLRAAETERDNARKKRVAVYRGRFVENPVLILPLTRDVNYTYNPNDLEALDDSNTVYPTLGASDVWGILTVTNGALMTREGGEPKRIAVPSPAETGARSLQGDGWTLELKEGWRLAPSSRKGDYVLTKDK